MKTVKQFINQLIPFIFAGIALVAFAFGILLLAYLFLFGALVGFVLFLAAWIRQKFFTPKSIMKRPSHKPGRTIDSDDWRKL